MRKLLSNTDGHVIVPVMLEGMKILVFICIIVVIEMYLCVSYIFVSLMYFY